MNYTLPTVTETGSGIGSSSCTPASGSTFPLGVSTVSCTATDVAGNTGTGSFTMTVNEVAPPPPTTDQDGRMYGAGYFADNAMRAHFAFRVSQVRNREYRPARVLVERSTPMREG